MQEVIISELGANRNALICSMTAAKESLRKKGVRYIYDALWGAFPNEMRDIKKKDLAESLQLRKMDGYHVELVGRLAERINKGHKTTQA